jgi:hypothetical protein
MYTSPRALSCEPFPTKLLHFRQNRHSIPTFTLNRAILLFSMCNAINHVSPVSAESLVFGAFRRDKILYGKKILTFVIFSTLYG